MFNRFWPKPPEAEGDDDAARPEEYRRNRNASVDDEEDEEEEEEDEEEEDDNEEKEMVRSAQGLRCPIARTLPRFMTHPRSIARYVENT